jgi:methionyl-tRNA synthetase
MLLNGGMWMMEKYGRGGYHGGMWSDQFGGDYGFFGPISLITFSIFSILAFLAVIWAVAIKGYSLWHAAQRKEKWWFIALLVINTFGILEIIYLLFFAKIWTKDKIAKVVESKTEHKKEDKPHSTENTTGDNAQA